MVPRCLSPHNFNTSVLSFTAQKVCAPVPPCMQTEPECIGEQVYCHCGMVHMLVAGAATHLKANCSLFERINQSRHSFSLHMRRCTGCHWGMATCCCPARRA